MRTYVRTARARTIMHVWSRPSITITRIIKCALSVRLIKNTSAYRSASFSCRFVAVFVSLARHGTERKLQLFIDWYCRSLCDLHHRGPQARGDVRSIETGPRCVTDLYHGNHGNELIRVLIMILYKHLLIKRL